MIHIPRIPSPTLALRAIVGCVLLWLVVVPQATPAGTFDTLSQAEQDAVLDRLKAELPTLLPEDDERAVTRTLRTLAAQDVRELSRLAGQAAGGEYQQAAEGLLRVGGEQLHESITAQIDTFIQGIENPIGQGALQFLQTHSEVAKKMAPDLLSGDWEAARDTLWEEAAKEIQASSTQTLINAYNWVFGARTRTVATIPVSPAHILMYAAQLETEILTKWKKQLKVEKMQEWYELYREVGWPAFEDQRLISNTAFGRSGALGELFGLGPADLKDIFTSCDEASVQTCLEARVEKARAEQRRMERALRRAAEAQEEALRQRLEAIEAEKERLAREVSPDFAAAMAEAKEIAAKIETAAGAVQAHCETFSEADRRRKRALAAVAEAEEAVAVVQRAIEAGAICREMEDHREGLAGDLRVLQDQKTGFDRALAEAETASREACAVADAVADAPDKVNGRASLDAATRHGSELTEAIQDAEALANRIREGKKDLTRSVTEIGKELEKARELAGSSAETEAAFEAIGAVGDARKEFEAARNTMESMAINAEGIEQVIEQVNPIDLNPIEYAAEWLAHTPNRIGNTRIFQLLAPYPNAPEVQTLLETVRDQLALVRPPSCVRHWESVQGETWRDPRIPAGLAAGAAEVRQACETVPDETAFQDLLREAERIAADMEAEEVGLWVHQREGEACVAEAVQAFAALPDAATALQASVTDLARICSEARTHADAARDAEDKARQTADRLLDGLVDLTPSGAATDAVSACGRLDEVRAGVVASSDRTKAEASAARSAASSATASLSSCASPADLAAAESAERKARAAARQATTAYAQAQEGDELFDQITTAAEAALGEMRQKRDRLNTLSIQKITLENHLDNLERSREEATAGQERCRAQQEAAREQWVAAGGASDPSLASLGRKIEAVDTDIGPFPGIGATVTGKGVLQTFETAERRIQEVVAELVRCSQAETAYGKVLEAKQAMLTLDSVDAELDALGTLRAQCESDLDSEPAPTASGKGGTGDAYDPREDPDGPSGGQGDSDRDRWVDLDGVDRGTEGGRVTPEPGYGQGGAIGPPTPGPPGGPPDEGFEEPPDEPDEPGPVPVDLTDPEIVDQGTSAGDPPGRTGPGSGRSPRDGRDRDEDDGDGPSRDDTVPGGSTGDVPPGGDTEEPDVEPGPDTGGGEDDDSPGGCCGDGDPGDGTTTPPDTGGGGGDTGAGGSDAECREVTQELIAHANTNHVLALFEAHEEDESCQWFADWQTEYQRLVEAVERACGTPMKNKDQFDQWVQRGRELCGDGGPTASGDGGSDYEPGDLWGGGDPCPLCKEAQFRSCMAAGHGDEAHCRRASVSCPVCPGGSDLSCENVYESCIQNVMYIKHQNRPDWDRAKLREKADGICGKC